MCEIVGIGSKEEERNSEQFARLAVSACRALALLHRGYYTIKVDTVEVRARESTMRAESERERLFIHKCLVVAIAAVSQTRQNKSIPCEPEMFIIVLSFTVTFLLIIFFYAVVVSCSQISDS
jgi:hypothetical protein